MCDRERERERERERGRVRERGREIQADTQKKIACVQEKVSEREIDRLCE